MYEHLFLPVFEKGSKGGVGPIDWKVFYPA